MENGCAVQGLRRLEMTDVKGMPSETDQFLRSLSALTCLHVSFTTPCTKLPPMHCLSDLVSLKVCCCHIPILRSVTSNVVQPAGVPQRHTLS